MSLVCKVCKTGDYVDKTEDQIICTKCGLVIAENIVVNHQTFSESSSGAATADGQFVSSSGRTFRGGNVPGLTRESREMTIENGRKRVQQMAAVLGLTSFHVEAAVLYSL
ncbi:transcription factor TFIIIB subunit brf1 [Balamuthia mandrillaris]